MKEDVRRSALSAAARVAFSTTLLSCGGQTTEAPSREMLPARPMEPPATSATAPATPPGDPHSTSATAPRVCSGAANVSECCLAFERKKRGGGRRLNASADAIACCEVTLAQGRAVTYAERSPCCDIVPDSFERFTPACMAWGPPCPPPMRALA
jgi:hypothetical protein